MFHRRESAFSPEQIPSNPLSQLKPCLLSFQIDVFNGTIEGGAHLQHELPMPRLLLWQNLANKLARRIATGRWPVGSLIPTELELMQKEGVSRNTVRAALAELVSRAIWSQSDINSAPNV